MYKEYASKVDDILAQQYGLGKGTIGYKNVNKEIMVLSLVIIDLMNKLEEMKQIFPSENIEEKKTKKSSK